MKPEAFVIKAEILDPRAKLLSFARIKTMYGGRRIAAGDTVFLFASENEGGAGLVARGTVVSTKPVAKIAGLARQTPRVSVSVKLVARARQALGRTQLRRFVKWDDGRPESELNFKFYRQATNKIAGISGAAATYLNGFF